ncbi:MAG: SPASM domain-containing protein, partial [Gammaproteobacteria bacterium]|nr:SPASM domain-containing protein [Gammaproteobacteria bacterium]
MVAHAKMRGLNAYVTTNGILLKQKIAQLYAAGLRDLTLGFYGIGSAYDEYVQRRDRFQELSAGVAAVRERYGMEVDMQLNFLLMRPTCSLAVVDEAWNFAVRYDMKFRTDLIHYSLPYFSEGPDRCLQFTPEDRGRIEQVVHRLLELKAAEPYRFCESVLGIRSIPDWLLKGPDMKVPCDAYRMVWVGADGSVQLCYVTFPLGNLHQHRLRELLFTAEHRQAARDAFALRCPNCHCERDTRIQKHAASRRLYG